MLNINRSKKVCPAEDSGMLDNIFRNWIHNPDKILKNYIKEDMVVLDVGCGPGLFSVAMAKMVGPTGKIIAADLQEAMLDKLKNKVVGTELEKRIELVKTASDKIGVTEKVDLVLAFWMVHEVPDQDNFFQEIKSILKPRGKIFVIEPKFHVSGKDFEKMIKVIEKSGLKIINKEKIFFSRAVVLESN